MPPNHTPPQLFLIDGYALIYRAFFAMISRPLRTAKGENTSAAWGVVNFLLRLREKYRPDYVAWINDAGTSFREERYADYKSTREKLDNELQADFDRSVQRIWSAARGVRHPSRHIPGYEADDVIGTLATAGAERGLQVVIVSGDKDFYQLVAPRVALLNPGRGGPAAVDESWVDEGNASDRLGVAPRQVVDFLALVGDSSDNIPGVKGIGEKGAQKLLAEFGDLETLLARAGEVTAKRAREALLTQADSARLSRELVTIKRDVPVELDAGALVPHEPDRDAVIRLLTELEFYSLARKLTGQGGGAAVEQSVAASVASAEEAEPSLDFGDASLATLTEEEGESTFSAESWLTLSDLSGPSAATVTVVDDPDDLPGLVERLRAAPIVGLDTESSSSEPHEWRVGRALAGCGTGGGLVSALRPPARRWGARGADPGPEPSAAYRSGFGTPLRPADRPGGAQGRARHQVRLAGPATGRRRARRGVVYDSMLASFVLDPGRRSHTIDTLCLEHLGRAMQTYQDLAGKGKSEIPFAEVAIPLAANYCGTDSATVLALHRFFGPMLTEMNARGVAADIEMPLVEVLVDMEWEGITIDLAVFRV